MTSAQAVCVKCGAFKRHVFKRCSACQYLPFSDYEKTRALILSPSFTVANTVIGRSAAELNRIAKEIRDGRPYLFDPNEEQVTLYACQDRLNVPEPKNRWRWVVLAIAVILAGAAFLIWL